MGSSGQIRRGCDRCGRRYVARSPRSRYCTDACRKAAAYERKHEPADGATVVELPGASTTGGNAGDEPGRTYAATLAALVEADRVETWQGAVALTLAQRLDDTPGGPAAALASRLSEAMAAALKGTEAPDRLDQLRQRRLAKMGQAG